MDHLIIGTGYLGERVATRLVAAGGHRVTVTTRRPERAETFRTRGFVPVLADVLQPAALADVPPADTVVYAVGFDRTAGRSMRELYVDGLSRVLGVLSPPRRFVYVSSTGVYGHAAGEAVDESAATDPLDESGRVVLEAETVLRERLPGAVILRFAGIYGPGRWLRKQDILAGCPLAIDPDKWLNLIHVEDGATAVLLARSARDAAVYNVSDGAPVKRSEFYTAMADLLGAPRPTFVPLLAGAVPDRHDRANRRVVSRRIREELGFEPRYPSFAEGLRAGE